MKFTHDEKHQLLKVINQLSREVAFAKKAGLRDITKETRLQWFELELRDLDQFGDMQEYYDNGKAFADTCYRASAFKTFE
jgi:hypothetical protein